MNHLSFPLLSQNVSPSALSFKHHNNRALLAEPKIERPNSNHSNTKPPASSLKHNAATSLAPVELLLSVCLD